MPFMTTDRDLRLQAFIGNLQKLGFDLADPEHEPIFREVAIEILHFGKLPPKEEKAEDRDRRVEKSFNQLNEEMLNVFTQVLSKESPIRPERTEDGFVKAPNFEASFEEFINRVIDKQENIKDSKNVTDDPDFFL